MLAATTAANTTCETTANTTDGATTREAATTLASATATEAATTLAATTAAHTFAPYSDLRIEMATLPAGLLGPTAGPEHGRDDTVHLWHLLPPVNQPMSSAQTTT